MPARAGSDPIKGQTSEPGSSPPATYHAKVEGGPCAGYRRDEFMPTPVGKESVTSPVPSTAETRQELPYRLRQQSLLGEFGRSALQTRDTGQILQGATELCAQGLETPYAKVLEYMPEEKR